LENIKTLTFLKKKKKYARLIKKFDVHYKLYLKKLLKRIKKTEIIEIKLTSAAAKQIYDEILCDFFSPSQSHFQKTTHNHHHPPC